MSINSFSCVHLFVPDLLGIRETWNRCAYNFSAGPCRNDDARGRGGAVCLQNDKPFNHLVPGPGLVESVCGGE